MGAVTLTAACWDELRWWIANLGRVNDSPIHSTPLAGRFDGVSECDAGVTGFGAVTFVEGLAAPSPTIVAAMRARPPPCSASLAVLRQVRQGIEFHPDKLPYDLVGREEQMGLPPIAPGWSGRVSAACFWRSGQAYLPLGAIGPAAASPAVRDRLGL